MEGIPVRVDVLKVKRILIRVDIARVDLSILHRAPRCRRIKEIITTIAIKAIVTIIAIVHIIVIVCADSLQLIGLGHFIQTRVNKYQ